MDTGLHGRPALVAAATSGLGYAVAAALAAEGCDVAICGRHQDRVDSALERLGTAGPGRMTGEVVDVTDDDAVRHWVAAVTDRYDGLDVVVTNAAGPPAGTVTEFAVADYRAACETSLLPHISLALASLPALREGGFGRLLVIASETVKQPIPAYGLSNVVRVGLVGFVRSLVTDLAGSGVTANVLAPGYHRTPALTRQFDDPETALARIGADLPVGHVGEPDDFAASAVMLASTRARSVTGEVLLVDGGAYRGLG